MFSLVRNFSIVLFLLAFVLQKNLELGQVDIRTDFLRVDSDEENYLKPPNMPTQF